MVKGKKLLKGSEGTKTKTISGADCFLDLKIAPEDNINSLILWIGNENYDLILCDNQIEITEHINCKNFKPLLTGTITELSDGNITFRENERGYECTGKIDTENGAFEINYVVDIIDGI